MKYIHISSGKLKDVLLDRRLSGQLMEILFPFALFSVSATCSALSDKSNMTSVIVWDIIFIFPFLILAIYEISVRCKEWNSDFKRFFYRNRILLGALFVVILMRAWQIGTVPRWDSETYYNSVVKGCSSFCFTIYSYVNCFRLASHPSLGYTLYLAIGSYLTPYSMVGVQLVNLVLYCLFTVYVYRILQHFFPQLSEGWIGAATLFISFEPMQLGTFSHLNLDFPILIFLMFLFYAHVQKKYLLFFFYACILVQSKEFGIVVLAGYTGGYILALLITQIQSERKIHLRKLLKDPVIIGAFASAFLMLMYFLVTNLKNFSQWGGGIKVGSENLTVAINYIDLNLAYVLLKCKTVFLINGYWVLTAVIVILSVLRISQCIRFREVAIAPELAGYLVSLAFLFAATCIYITYNNPRYHLALETGLAFFAVWLILKMIEGRRLKQGLFVLISIWMIAESYTTIDPVSFILFPAVSTGNHTAVIHPVWNNNPYMADTAVYNNQLDYLDKAYNLVLQEVGYNEDMDILILGEYMMGVRAVYLEGRYLPFYWDPDTEKRTMKETENTIRIEVITDETYEEKAENGELKDGAVAIFTPQYGVNEEEYLLLLEETYIVGDRQTVSIWMQGEVYYYELQLRE